MIDEDDREELIEHFNAFDENEGDLGAILYGDLDAFQDRVKFLDDNV